MSRHITELQGSLGSEEIVTLAGLPIQLIHFQGPKACNPADIDRPNAVST
ncbi:hypothetical protein LMG31884_25410 [Xanthomonas hydrangeae]|nr:hypothetical protein LMG31884_25410 [Xanthomonas hydrangeae]CAD7717294.1 hypothetical protein LMG31884_25410 [Xanthomonas hydrangeae]CAD7733822.1 hypothetical protein LMG31887_25290 [Xanthomonas hydrangeae]CAD7733825.1 hypothetical protein LMG31887_25290 [Xanthomonas hydrangeae]